MGGPSKVPRTDVTSQLLMLEIPRLLHVGNNNWIAPQRILSAIPPTSAFSKRLVEEAKATGLLLDFTGTLKTQGILVMDNGIVIRVAMRPKDVAKALESLDKPAANLLP